VITEAHLRLRALPAARLTLLATGTRDDLSRAGRELMENQLTAASLELCSPEACGLPTWGLVLDLLGTPEAVEAEALRVEAPGELGWTRLDRSQASAISRTLAGSPLGFPVTLRLGVFPDGLDETIDLLEKLLGPGVCAAGAGRGLLRWSGSATAESLREVRRTLAGREIPVTLERAPWEIRRRVGHFGEYREGVGGLVSRLRHVFDPDPIFQVALSAAPSE
jgi:hypothetical protein